MNPCLKSIAYLFEIDLAFCGILGMRTWKEPFDKLMTLLEKTKTVTKLTVNILHKANDLY